MSNALADRKPAIAPGNIFNKWTVLSEESKDKYGHRQWLCRCECGTERSVIQGNLNNGNSKDCGCGRVAAIAKALTIHGLCGTAEYEKTRKRAYREKNIEACKEHDREYAKKNPHIMQAKNAARRATKLKAVPSWAADTAKRAFVDLFKTAGELKALTGVSYHIDHIVPLKGKAGKLHVVSGLHVAENFQILPATENQEKYATTWPDQWTYDEAHIAELAVL
jgi:hypothetical protein